MRKKIKTLKLAKETLGPLTGSRLSEAAGGRNWSLYGAAPETCTCLEWSNRPCPSLRNSDCTDCVTTVPVM